MQVAVTGATGFIGRQLLEHLARRGDSVNILSRNPDKARGLPGVTQAFRWAGESSPMPVEAFDDVDAVIHLAGEPIAGVFTAAHKRRVYDSRVQGTARLVEALARTRKMPRRLVSSSAIGYYGNRGSETLTEHAAPGQGFLSDVCVAWEQAAVQAERLDVEVARVRTGIVFGPGGGALKPMLIPFRLGLGGPFGKGDDWWSWVHLDDLCRLYLHIADGNGGRHTVFNGTAPNPVTNRDLTKAIGRTLHRPTVLPVPKIAVRLAMGEAADALVLQSARVLPEAALETGFRFSWEKVDDALRDVLKQER